MRILVTGSRDWTDYRKIEQAILDSVDGASEVTIVHGDARGADSIADVVARVNGFAVERHPANWKMFGKAAGPLRNQKMVDLGADAVLAFLLPGSIGTADCIKRAKKAGLHVVEYHATL